eukprot:gnl/TRDRNA2_/TRDRNA2_183766_c0_seq1.p1 gnl/TRDRNA2_/TRDRNA2_183766_c0~~gnl/TRDRNA2_/TRDRNA2_183766_c0_seq1.p1  ORF type:complete len:109 (+),score=24.42 gnl/TRDRNA2_/TRDRNA2_183766_c0_seq1:39-329(+)
MDPHQEETRSMMEAPPDLGLRPMKRKKRKQRSFLEYFLRKVQKPEVILLSVWWLIMLVLVVYMAEMGALLHAIWRPLALLLGIPVLFFVLLCFLTL